MWGVGRVVLGRGHVFGGLAKRELSSSIALVVRNILPKFYHLIKYSHSCNLETETFVQNPMRKFVPCVPKIKSYFVRRKK